MVSGVLALKLRRDLWARRRAVISLMLVVSVGIAAFVAMSGAWLDLDDARARFYTQTRLHDMQVIAKRIPRSVVTRLTAHASLLAVRGSVQVAARALVSKPGDDLHVTGVAASMPWPRRPVLNDLRLVTGGWFSGPRQHEVLLNHAFAEAHGLTPGSMLSITYDRRQRQLIVVGTVRSPEYVYVLPPDGGLAPDPARFAVMYLPEQVLAPLAGLDGAVNRIVARVADPALADWTLAYLQQQLEPYGVVVAEHVNDQVSVRLLADEIDGLGVQARVLPAVFLIAAALVLSVVMRRLVDAQRTVVGTLRALGVSRVSVALHFGGFALVIAIGGTLVGLLLAHLLQTSMVSVYGSVYVLPDLKATVHWPVVSLAAGLAVAVALLGALRGIWRANGLAPADAMRPVPPERGGRIWIEAAPWLWRLLDSGTRIASRTVFRNPFRSLVAVSISAVTTALIVCTLNLEAGAQHLMHHEFELSARYDAAVALSEVSSTRVLQDVKRLTRATYAEPALHVRSVLKVGNNVKRAQLIGLDQNRVLHAPRDVDGAPLRIPASGIALATQLARTLGAPGPPLRVGDVVDLQVLDGQRQRTRAQVAAIADSYIGASVYADRAYVSRLLGERDVLNAINVRRDGASIAERERRHVTNHASIGAVIDRRRALDQFEQNFGALMRATSLVLVGIVGLVAFAATMNAQDVAVSERLREIGTLRVLGMSPLRVTYVFGLEALVLALPGVALGLVGGVYLSDLLSLAYSTEIIRFPGFIAPAALTLAAVLMLCFVLTAVALTWRSISRLDWRGALSVKE